MPPTDPTPRPAERPLRIVLALRAINFDRVFEGLLRELLGRGHEIRVLLEREKRGLPAHATALFDALAAEHPGFSYGPLPRREDRWVRIATPLRFAIDYLRYLEPEFAEADALRERARKRAPRWARTRFASRPRARRLVDGAARRIEARVPVPGELRETLRATGADVLLVSPLVGLGSEQGDLIRAADQLGLPTVLPVASWDNLTNKGVIRDRPDATIVWNDAQVQEAVTLHGLPRESVHATGAHTYDHWFAWGPRTSREEFCAKVGLPDGPPLLLYVCSSKFIAPDEVGFVEEWLARLRADGPQGLRDAAILVRPHPQNVKQWQDHDLRDSGPSVVWPVAGAAPTDDGRKADYYDSIHHAVAVVGINTSALIETAIVGRPVFTIEDPRFRSSQGGTLHFAHLTGAGGQGGVLTVARSWDEHHAQLGAALEDPETPRRRIEAFLRAFVRPHGLDVPAAPRAADVIERVATTPKQPVRRRAP